MSSRIGLAAWLAVALLAVCVCPCAQAAAGFGQISGPGGCLAESGSAANASCGEGEGIFHPKAIAVSPDGANVYVVGGVEAGNVAQSFGAVGILKRNPTTGEVTDVGCLSSDGTDGRDGASGLCTPTPSLLGADGVTVAPDGRTVFVTASSSGGIVAFAREPATGALSRLGCLQVTPRPGSPCTAAHIFDGAADPISNASGSALYLASSLESAIAGLAAPTPSGPEGASAPAAASVASLFTSTPGPVSLNSCIATNGDDGACAVGVAMKGVQALALGPEGKQLYAAAPSSHAVDVFSLGEAGGITQTGCTMASPPPGLCTGSRFLDSPSQLAITPDGRDAYVADTGSTGAKIDVLARNPASGQLADIGCVDHLPAPEKSEPNEEEEEPGERAEKEKEKQQEKEKEAADPCTRVPGLEDVKTIAVGGEGSEIYAFGSGSAVSFSRNAESGALTETACAAGESESNCSVLPDLTGVEAAAVSPDGRNVYVVTSNSKALLAFGIGPAIMGAASTSRPTSALVRVACPARLAQGCRGRVIFTRMLRRHAGRRRHAVLARIVVGRSHSFTIAPGSRPNVLVRLVPAAGSFLHRHHRIRVTASVHAARSAGGSGLGRSVWLYLRH